MTTSQIDFKQIALCHMADPELLGIDFYLINITPDLAKQMLMDNALGQRNPSDVTIGRYGEDMTIGAWRFAGDPIRYNAAGQLIDGQHRLAAVASGVEDILNLVITGLDPDIMSAIDTGRRRSLGDVLKIENPDIKYPRTIAGILGQLWYYEVAKCFFVKGMARQAAPSDLNSAMPSHAQLLNTMHSWQGRVGTTVEQAAIFGHKAYNANGGISPSTFGRLYMDLSGYDKDIREQVFAELIGEPRTTAGGYPINALRSRLNKLARNQHESWGTGLQNHFLNLAVNALLSGDEITTLRTPPNMVFPFLAELKHHADGRANMGLDPIPAAA